MRTKAECEYLIRRKQLAPEESLCVRPLTKAELDRMPEAVYEWHLIANKDNLEKAANESQTKKQNETAAFAQKANRHKTHTATSEDLEAVKADGLKFAEDYPQLIRDSEQNQVLFQWILDRSLPIEYGTLVQAFEALAQTGELLLNPSACDAGSESEVTGHRLKTHPNLWKLLAPYNAATRERYEVGKMSAKDYKAASLRENPEDWPETVPELVQRKIDRVVSDFFALHPEHAPSDETRQAVREFFDLMNWGVREWNLTNLSFAFEELIKAGAIPSVTNPGAIRGGQVTKVVDLSVGREQRAGWPASSQKGSFQKKINSLSAEEFQAELNVDPAFRAAVNALG